MYTWSPEEEAITCSTTCCPTWALSASASLGEAQQIHTNSHTHTHSNVVPLLFSSHLFSVTVKCFVVLILITHENWIDMNNVSICGVCCVSVSQVLVPSLLVPSQSAVCHMCVQPPVCPQYPLLFLLQHSSSGTVAHEHLLVLGEDTQVFFFT